MRFHDYTLVSGTIATRRYFDTATLDAIAVARCQEILADLRRGATFVEHGVTSLPVFGVSLGSPDWLLQEMGEQVEAPNRFFCVGEPGMQPFQINFILGASEPSVQDTFAVGTILALSTVTGNLLPDSESELEALVTSITDQRPVVATALMPTYPVDRRVMMLAADFATCFAAALFLEGV